MACAFYTVGLKAIFLVITAHKVSSKFLSSILNESWNIMWALLIKTSQTAPFYEWLSYWMYCDGLDMPRLNNLIVLGRPPVTSPNIPKMCVRCSLTLKMHILIQHLLISGESFPLPLIPCGSGLCLLNLRSCGETMHKLISEEAQETYGESSLLGRIRM